MAEILLSDLTESKVNGTGVFDVLMQATKAHLEEEYNKGRIKGPEYSTVYLGAMQAVMSQSLEFLLTKQRSDLEAQLLAQQILSETKQRELTDAQILNLASERDRIDAEVLLTNKQIEKMTADINISIQQLANLAAEKLLTDQQVLVAQKQVTKMDSEIELTDQQILNMAAEKLLTDQKAALTTQQVLNAETENTVLVAQECKLKAEFDQLVEMKLKTISETALLAQKKVTEQAQTSGAAVDADSVIGRQKGLYVAQTDGFKRDAEQKAAKLLIDTWNVRKTTDSDGTPIDSVNKLEDTSIGRVIDKMLAGINA